jgi:hypothetical protein
MKGNGGAEPQTATEDCTISISVTIHSGFPSPRPYIAIISRAIKKYDYNTTTQELDDDYDEIIRIKTEVITVVI